MLQDGVWVVVATPFDDDLQLDLGSLGRLVRHYSSIGVTGLTVLGVFGEAASLSLSERADVLTTVVRAVNLPLVVGMTSLATAPLLEEVRMAQEILGDRLAAAMIQVNSPSAEVVSAHLGAIIAATGAAVVLQDYPVATGVTIPGEALLKVLETTPGIAAVKAEAPPTSLAISVLSSSGVPVFGGLGGMGLLDELACGAAGVMTGFSYPEALIACLRAYRDGGYRAARSIFAPFLPLINFEQQAKIALAIRKECLCVRGLIDTGAIRPPAVPLPSVLAPHLLQHVEFVESLLRESEESSL
jgi:4-hydroxy-tetrahydrodipicolinate synthase